MKKFSLTIFVIIIIVRIGNSQTDTTKKKWDKSLFFSGLVSYTNGRYISEYSPNLCFGTDLGINFQTRLTNKLNFRTGLSIIYRQHRQNEVYQGLGLGWKDERHRPFYFGIPLCLESKVSINKNHDISFAIGVISGLRYFYRIKRKDYYSDSYYDFEFSFDNLYNGLISEIHLLTINTEKSIMNIYLNIQITYDFDYFKNSIYFNNGFTTNGSYKSIGLGVNYNI